MKMYICSRCKGRCDPGEIVGKVCAECLEEEKQEIIRSQSVIRMMNSPSYQMELNLEVMSNGR